MRGEAVDRNAIAAWRWSLSLVALGIFVAAGILLFSWRLPPAMLIGVLALLALLLPAWTWWYPPARYRHLRYRLDENGITVQEGIFWRELSAIPRIRIQHTDVYQGPLQRHYGIATLKLYTAGSRFTRTELPGLSYETAIKLRESLQRDGDGDAI